MGRPSVLVRRKYIEEQSKIIMWRGFRLETELCRSEELVQDKHAMKFCLADEMPRLNF